MARPTFLSILRKKLRIWIFLPSLVFVLGLGILMANSAYNEVKKRNRTVSGAISYYISSYIDGSLHALRYFSKRIAPGESDMKKSLENFYGAYPHFERLLWLSREGTILAAAPAGAEGLPFPIKIAPQPGGSIITRPIVSPESGHPVIYLGVPHPAGNMLVGEMDTLTLSQHLGGMLPPGNIIILTDAFGNIVSHPDRAKVLRQENIGDMPLLQAREQEGRVLTKMFTHEDRLYIGSLARIPGEDWKIMILSQASTVFIPVIQAVLALIALVTTLFLIARALLGNSIKTGLVLPLEDFIDDIKQLAAGGDIADAPFRATYRELEAVEEEFRTMSREVRGREEELCENAERYRALFEDNQLVLLLVDPVTGGIMDSNKQAARYYGYTRTTLNALTIHDLDANSRDTVQGMIDTVQANHDASHFRTRHKLAGDVLRDVEVHVSPMTIRGEPRNFVTVIDIARESEVPADPDDA
ncbi:PAS domain S-box protein [Salidesulfovibrio onnuriiensis]|uniref:PAS domain S-box protein n=1 Tax=Salidesulfovibrio onnuriiensis TaxID=2583823 RepID=UPI0011C8B7C1|nr:PAS domain S-box protein [Salidesulfovibrio onnuriiensis]